MHVRLIACAAAVAFLLLAFVLLRMGSEQSDVRRSAVPVVIDEAAPAATGAFERTPIDAALEDPNASGVAASQGAPAHLEVHVERSVDGTRLAGIEVVATASSEDAQRFVSVSDADGRVAFDLAPNVEWSLVTTPNAELRALAAYRNEGPFVAGTSHADTIPVHAGVIATGLVVDEAGRPIAGARVAITGTTTNSPGTASAQDGSFTLCPLPNRFKLFAEADGYAARYAVDATAGAEGRVDGLRLVLARPRPLTGHVTCAGQPAVNARIGVTSEDGRPGRTFWFAPPPRTETAADSDGRYAITSVIAHSADIDVRADGAIGRRLEAAVDGGVLDIDLRPATALVVRVTDPTGAPIAGCRVRVFADVGFDIDDVDTNADGIAQVPGMPRGEPISIYTSAEGYVDAALEGVTPAYGPEPFAIALERGAPLRGRVVDLDGAPVPSARVTVFGLENGAPTSNWIADDRDLEQDGSFEITTLAQGQYVLLAEKYDRWWIRAQPVIAATGTSPTLVLDARTRPTTTLHAVVRDALTGRPVPHFSHMLYVQNASTRVDAADGKCTIEHVPVEGTTWLEVEADTYDRWKSEPLRLATPVHEIDVRLWPVRDVAVRVVAASGTELPLAEVEAFDDAAIASHAARGEQQPVAVAAVDLEGFARLSKVPARPIRLEVAAWSGGPRHTSVLDLTAPPAGPITVTLPDWSHAAHRLRVALRTTPTDLMRPGEVHIVVLAGERRIASGSLSKSGERFTWTFAGHEGFADEPVIALDLPLVDLQVQLFANGFTPATIALAADRTAGGESMVTLEPAVEHE